jgi:uncharacterized protein (DUF433 family)
MITTAYRHITADLEGVPLIDGTSMKVVELILDSKAYGWSPEELHFQHPYLSMAQIHSALAYYWDHKDELDRDIERRLKLVDRLKEDLPPTRLDERLRATGLV